jgi:hypothetical protein
MNEVITPMSLKRKQCRMKLCQLFWRRFGLYCWFLAWPGKQWLWNYSDFTPRFWVPFVTPLSVGSPLKLFVQELERSCRSYVWSIMILDNQRQKHLSLIGDCSHDLDDSITYDCVGLLIWVGSWIMEYWDWLRIFDNLRGVLWSLPNSWLMGTFMLIVDADSV